MKEQNYKEKMETALKSIESIPKDDPVRTKAFEMIFADLIGKTYSGNKIIHDLKHKVNRSSVKIENDLSNSESSIVEKIDAEDFSHIHEFNQILDRCLYILKVAREKNYADGLIPSEIANILTTRFRIKVSQFAISNLLKDAGKMVDRIPVKKRGGTAFKYKIMKSGEDYINKKIKEGDKNES